MATKSNSERPAQRPAGKTAPRPAQKGAAKAVRNNKWYIYKTAGLLLPGIEMLSNERLGIFTKAVVGRITGHPEQPEAPQDMNALLNKMLQICHLRPDKFVPFWVILYARARASAPVLFAMADKTVGAMTRCYIASILGKKSPGFPAGEAESAAVLEHMKEIDKWLAAMPSSDTKAAYEEAQNAATKLANVLELSEEEAEGAAHVIGASFADVPDVAQTARELALIELAKGMRNGEDLSENEIVNTYRTAEAEDMGSEDTDYDNMDYDDVEDDDPEYDDAADDDYSDVADEDDEPMTLGLY